MATSADIDLDVSDFPSEIPCGSTHMSYVDKILVYRHDIPLVPGRDYVLDFEFTKDGVVVPEINWCETSDSITIKVTAKVKPEFGPTGMELLLTPLGGPETIISELELPYEGPTALTSELDAPYFGPAALSSELELPYFGPSAVITLATPASGPSDVSQLATPVSGPSSVTPLATPASGPSSVTPLATPASGPSSVTQLATPVSGPTSVAWLADRDGDGYYSDTDYDDTDPNVTDLVAPTMGPVEGSVHTQIQWEETDAEYWMENANIANMWGGGAYHREFYLKSDGTLYGRGSNEGGAVGAGISGPAVGARIGGGMTLWQKGFSVGTYGRLAKDTKYGAQYGINDEWFTGTYEDYAIVQQAQPINLTDVTKIVVGAGATFFLKSDNSMWAAGSSGIYELDSNYPWNQTSSSTPVQLLADVTDIAALKYGGVALTTAGKVVKWGINNIGYKTGASWSSNPASTAGVNNTPYEQLEEVMASGGQNIWSDPGPNGAIWIKKNSNELWAVADYPSNWGGNWEIPTYGTPNSGQAWSGISGWAGFETPQQVAFSGVASIIDIATYGSGRAALTQMTSGNYQVWVWGQRSPLFEENPVKLAGEITAPVSSMTPKNIVMNSTYITVRLESGQLLRSSGLETGGIPGQSPFVSAEPSIDVITSGYPSNKSSYGDGWGGNRLLQAGVTRFDSGSNHYAIPESSAWPVVGYSTAKNFWDTDVLAGLCFDKHPSLNIWMWNNTCTIPNSNSGSPGVQRTDPLFYPDGFPE